jgi:aminoglycoside 2'-N-acetyltransferase I
MQTVDCEIQSGEGGWPRAASLLGQVGRRNVVAELAWKDVHWAHADRRVLLWAADGRLACHVGLFARNGTWNGAPIRLAGVGGVAT